MTIKFVTEDFKEEVLKLLDFFDIHEIQHDFEFLYDVDDIEDDEDIIIDEDYIINPWPPRSLYEETHTIGELLNMYYEVNKVVEFDEYKFIGERVALFYIDSQIQEYINIIEIPIVKEVIDGQEYSIDIASGLTAYGLKLIIDNIYSKYIPPVDEHDNFIRINADNKVDKYIIDSLIEAYLFELKSTLNINIHLSPRISNDFMQADEPEYKTDTIRLRPLLMGKGIHELLKLYNSSLTSTNSEIRVLTYTKVIEYVSQTVIQQDLISSATKKLFSPRALNPDANYILELSKIFEGNRNNQKDYFAIKITIKTCCDLNEIVSTAPPFLKSIKKLKQNSKLDDIDRAIEEIANAISNTRNMFAHAKTNYEKKGMECPTDQLIEFTNCLDILSQQIIRWFAKEHEDNRVI